MDKIVSIVDSRHPSFLSGVGNWSKYRMTHNAGDDFRDSYLQRFSEREELSDFVTRKAMTPIPAFSKCALNDVRNAIFQRMRDITRRGGSKAYQNAVNGLDLGVDRRGSTMNAFFGVKVLTELLLMGRVGVFVDAPALDRPLTLADAGAVRPYLYSYAVEDILSWTCSKPDEPSEFQALLLRDSVLNYDPETMLPTLMVQRYRRLWIGEDNGRVNLQFYDIEGTPVDRHGLAAGPVQLELTRIPFVMLDIGDSLIKDVCQQEIAPLPQ